MKLLIVLKKKFKNEQHEFCPFCSNREEAFYDVNPYCGEVKLELAIEQESFYEADSINQEDWLLP